MAVMWLAIHDLDGRQVAGFPDGWQAAGEHEAVWRGQAARPACMPTLFRVWTGMRRASFCWSSNWNGLVVPDVKRVVSQGRAAPGVYITKVRCIT